MKNQQQIDTNIPDFYIQGAIFEYFKFQVFQVLTLKGSPRRGNYLVIRTWLKANHAESKRLKRLRGINRCA